jgi:hypothetical protein
MAQWNNYRHLAGGASECHQHSNPMPAKRPFLAYSLWMARAQLEFGRADANLTQWRQWKGDHQEWHREFDCRTASTIEVLKDGGAGGQGSFFMEGGTLNVGSASAAGVIGLAKFGAGTNSQAVFSQSGGIIRAWGGIISGGSGTFNSSSLSAFTNSGGFLYIGNVGVSASASAGLFLPPTISCSPAAPWGPCKAGVQRFR